MRSSFQYRQPLTPEQHAEVMGTATIVLDANILLNLVRYSKESSDTLFRILEENAHRLWLPHQVGNEFYRNVEREADSQQRTVNELKVTLKKTKTTLQNATRTLNEEAQQHLNDSISRRFNTLENNVDMAVKKHGAAVASVKDLQPVLQRIENLYDGKVGSGYSAKKLRKIYQDGLRRAVNKTPPGFEDTHDGDLVIWHQILDHAKAEMRNVLFVTEDSKSDWWLKGNGRPRAHPDLVAEFKRASGGALLQFQDQKAFMRAFEGDTPLAESVLREVESSAERRSHFIPVDIDVSGLLPNFSSGLDTMLDAYRKYVLPDSQLAGMIDALGLVARNQIPFDVNLLFGKQGEEDPQDIERKETEEDGKTEDE